MNNAELKFDRVIRARASGKGCKLIKEAAEFEGVGLSEFMRRALAERVLHRLEKCSTDARNR